VEIKELLTRKREEILRMAANRGAYNVRIFGSALRDDAGPSSDVDFLVDLDPERSLLDVGGLVMDLQNLLGLEVDIVTEKGLHWYIRGRVIAEARPL
jgi:predicted nucleotidyltransferase